MKCHHVWKIYRYESENSPAMIFCKKCNKFLGLSEHKNKPRLKYFLNKIGTILYMLTQEEKTFYYKIKNVPFQKIDWKTAEKITNLYYKYPP